MRNHFLRSLFPLALVLLILSGMGLSLVRAQPPQLPENPGTISNTVPDTCSRENLDRLRNKYLKAKELSGRSECHRYLADMYYYRLLRLQCSCTGTCMICGGHCDNATVQSFYVRERVASERFNRLLEEGKCAPPPGGNGRGESGGGGGGSGTPTTSQVTATTNGPPLLVSREVAPKGGETYRYTVSLRDPDGDTVTVQLCIASESIGWECSEPYRLRGEGYAYWDVDFSGVDPGVYRYRFSYDDGQGHRGVWGPYDGPVISVTGSTTGNGSGGNGSRSGGMNDAVSGAVGVGIATGTGIAVAKKVRGRRSGVDGRGSREKEKKGRGDGEPRDDRTDLDRFTRAVEDSNRGWAPKTKQWTDVIGQAGAYSTGEHLPVGVQKGVEDAADRILKGRREKLLKDLRDLRKGKSLSEVARGGGKEYERARELVDEWRDLLKGKGKGKWAKLTNLQAEAGGVKKLWLAEKYLRLKGLAKQASRTSKIVKGLKNAAKGLGKALQRASEAASRYAGAASVGLQVYDGTTSYNKFVSENGDFIRENPVLGRVLAASKAVGEQIIIYGVTKNPVIGLTDAIVSMSTGGKVSVASALGKVEGVIDMGTKAIFEKYYESEYSSYSKGVANHESIRSHFRKLNDPDFVKQLKERGWTDDRIDRVRRSMREMMSHE